MRRRYKIGLAAERHVRAIPAIEQAAAALFSESDLPPEVRFLVTDMDTLVEAQREGRLWSAVDDRNRVVGFALARVVDGNAHLEEMNVHPDHGRQGIGSQLLATVIAWAKAAGYAGVTLITFRHLPWNAPFYERHGFVQIDEGNTSISLRDLIREEAAAGLERRNRVAMCYEFSEARKSA